MTRKIITILMLVGGLLVNNLAIASSVVLQDIRIGANKTTTRIVMEFNKKVEYSIFSLKNPYRIVIDTTDFKTKLAPETMFQKGAIRSIRTGTFSPNVSRTVIDLKFPVKIKKISNFKQGVQKLVVDIIKTSSKQHSQQKAIKSPKWNVLEKKSKIQQKAELDKKSKPIKKLGKPLIIIDAGHGGPDPGSIGVGKLYEKHVTLAISKKVYAELKKSGKFNVGMTRNRDIYIPLRTRYRIAERRQADLFISIHADSHSKKSVGGMSIYTLSNKASDREAAKLAQKENAFDQMVGNSPLKNEDDIAKTLLDLSQGEVMNSASRISNLLIKVAKKNKIRLLRRSRRFAGFAVLKSPHVPSILIETGYMSNRHDVRNLRDPKWQTKFAKALTNALIKYFKKYQIKK